MVCSFYLSIYLSQIDNIYLSVPQFGLAVEYNDCISAEG